MNPFLLRCGKPPNLKDILETAGIVRCGDSANEAEVRVR